METGGSMVWGGFWMLLWLVLPIIAIFALAKWLNGAGRNRSEQDALDILKSRYARGEIDQAEFERKRQTLES